MKDFGRRVQFSVFEAQLDGALLDRLRARTSRVSRVIDTQDDRVRIYRLCAEREQQVEIVGPKARPSRKRSTSYEPGKWCSGAAIRGEVTGAR